MKSSVQDIENNFKKSWQERSEAYYTHWTRTEPENQIQLAFRNHWTLFNELLNHSPMFNKGKRSLEVGCGRGSLSGYFSDAGYDCTLLDISDKVITIAQDIFAHHQLPAKFVVGDAQKMPFEDNSFDVIFSIGLFEHFESPEPFIKEQMRVLDKGGMLFAYIVPKYVDNVQKDYTWINELLEGYAEQAGNFIEKDAVFRSDDGSERYVPLFKKHYLQDVQASGVYPLPMISHSTEFPFTLMPPKSEVALTKHFENTLAQRRTTLRHHPWLCEEGYGQAFLVWGYKAP